MDVTSLLPVLVVVVTALLGAKLGQRQPVPAPVPIRKRSGR
jgi:hypothetical protein